MADLICANVTQAEVQSKVTAAANGDRVIVPAGSATWGTGPGTTAIAITGKYITLQGAGIGLTNITDNSSGSNNSLIRITGVNGGLMRVTGFTFIPGTFSCITGIVSTDPGGTSDSLRIDHNSFTTLVNSNMAIRINGPYYGVADHNTFVLGPNHYAFYMFNVDSGDWGDIAWTQASPFGTSHTFFIEQNTFSASPGVFSAAVDVFRGGTYVARYNTVTETIGFRGHGLQSQERYRSQRHCEIYENDMSRSGASLDVALAIPGGTAVIYNNRITGVGYNRFGDLSYQRDGSSQAMYGQAGWLTVTSITRSGSTATLTVSAGHHVNSPSGWTARIKVQGATQTEYNGTFDVTYISATQVSFTVTGTPATPATGLIFLMSPWDQNSLNTGYAAIDQPGRGRGDMIADVFNPGPAQWSNQALEPIYAWGNTWNGATATVVSGASQVVEGRDFFNGTAKPGYVAYTYPHPLQGAADTTPPAAPTGITVV